MKLRRVLAYAYDNVSFYRELFRKNGISRDEIKRVKDLDLLPIIDKTDLQKTDVSKWLDRTVNDRQGLVRIATSGSSGFPLSFFIDRNYDQCRNAIAGDGFEPVRQRLRRHLGPAVTIRFRQVDEIPRTERGKHRVFVRAPEIT